MDGRALALVSDSKYGYRGEEDALSLTLINSAVNPDPYPERGIHAITLWLGLADDTGKDLQALTDELNHGFFYQPAKAHGGSLPARFGLLALSGGAAAVTSVQTAEGALLVRGYETKGEAGEARLAVNAPVKAARLVDLSEGDSLGEARVRDGEVLVPMRPGGVWAVEIVL